MIDLFGRTVCSLFQNSGVVLVMNKGMQAVWAAAAHVGPLAEHAMLRPGAMCFSHSNRLLPVVRAALSSRSMASSRSGNQGTGAGTSREGTGGGGDKGPDKQARSREFLPGRPIQLRKIQLSRMGAGKRSGLILDNQRRERRKANEGLFGVFCAGGLLDRLWSRDAGRATRRSSKTLRSIIDAKSRAFVGERDLVLSFPPAGGVTGRNSKGAKRHPGFSLMASPYGNNILDVRDLSSHAREVADDISDVDGGDDGEHGEEYSSEDADLEVRIATLTKEISEMQRFRQDLSESDRLELGALKNTLVSKLLSGLQASSNAGGGKLASGDGSEGTLHQAVYRNYNKRQSMAERKWNFLCRSSYQASQMGASAASELFHRVRQQGYAIHRARLGHLIVGYTLGLTAHADVGFELVTFARVIDGLPEETIGERLRTAVKELEWTSAGQNCDGRIIPGGGAAGKGGCKDDSMSVRQVVEPAAAFLAYAPLSRMYLRATGRSGPPMLMQLVVSDLVDGGSVNDIVPALYEKWR